LSNTELWEWDKEEHCTGRTGEVTVSRVHIITSVKTYVKCVQGVESKQLSLADVPLLL